MDDDTYEAACAQQEQDERRRREDEVLERHRWLRSQFLGDCTEFDRRFKADMNRIFTPTQTGT